VLARSREAVVRRYLEPFDGVDFLTPVRDVIARREELGDKGAVASMGPAWEVIAPDIEWDTSAVVGEGSAQTTLHGHSGFLDFWTEWLGVWDEYVYTVHAYEKCARWIIAEVGMRATGRGGIPIDGRVAQAFYVRDGKVTRVRVFRSMDDARRGLASSRRKLRR
jgi:hypothetical protein